MSDPFYGEIRFFGFSYAPENWAQCNGQILPIDQNAALYSLLGNIYGGDGRSTFGLPNLQGRVPMHQGRGAGLTTQLVGQYGGYEAVPLNTAQLPAHNHTATLHGETDLGTTQDPKGNMLAAPSEGTKIYAPPVSADNRAMFGDSITVNETGNSQVHTNMQPYLALNACISLNGLYPERS